MPCYLSKIWTEETFTAKIFRDPDHPTLENRIFNVMLIMITFTGICATVLSLYSGSPLREVVLTIVSTAVPIGFYIASRWFHADK